MMSTTSSKSMGEQNRGIDDSWMHYGQACNSEISFRITTLKFAQALNFVPHSSTEPRAEVKRPVINRLILKATAFASAVTSVPHRRAQLDSTSRDEFRQIRGKSEPGRWCARNAHCLRGFIEERRQPLFAARAAIKEVMYRALA